MPKLNVQQNNQNVIQSLANGVAIGRLNGIIACDGANNFSVAEAGGGGGRNLLDNPFFTAGNVVNQRGFSSSSAEGYTVDRWKLLRSNIITATLGNDGLTISKSVTGYAFFEQIIGTSIDLEATYTLSVMTSDGQVYSATRKFANGTSSETYVSIGGMNVGFGLYGKDTTPHAALYFGTSQTGSLTIKAIKLELGSASTLANDAPPDYGEELAKCQRYFQRVVAPSYGNGFGFGRAASATECRVYIPLPVPLRAPPTVSIANIGSVSLAGNGNTYSCTAMAYSGRSESGVNLSFTTSGLTTNQLYLLYRSGSADVYIDLSADL